MISVLANAILDEEMFARFLSLERKRTDRSQRPFLLLALELKTPLWDKPRKKRTLIKHVIQSLQGCTRQTDVIGWYRNNAVIGVIFTELWQEIPPTDRILERVKTALQARLALEQTDAITISAYLYPLQDFGAPEFSNSDKLYPDIKQKKAANFLKRIFDVLGGLGLLVVLSPLFVLIGMAIKCTSKGPILYKQTRIGQFGGSFTMLKFRSMYSDANPRVHEQYVQKFIRQGRNGNAASETLKQDGLFKLSKDARITPIGHVLRKTSLDELPQLFNVLAGTMSLVGPRPPLSYEVKWYDTWHMRRMLEPKPGITGLWQVKGRSRTTFDDMVRLDLKYIDAWSLRTDFRLLLQTPWVIFRCDGAR
jgi:lipopolysaccharide/colanic/teichoic acid biosynthesis glycosyltransferase